MGLWDKVKALFKKDEAAPASAAGSTSAAVSTSAPATKSPFTLGALLDASADEVLARAQKGLRWSPWQWRRDTIPPLADERTALLDRTMVLRGLTTSEELEKLHAIGDEWLLHKERATAVELAGRAGGNAAVEAMRAEKKRVREEKRAAAAAKRAERRRLVEERKQNDIVFLGRGVSGALGKRTTTSPRHFEELPKLATPADVAAILGLSIRELRGLAFHADAAARVHYVQFDVPKKTGGVRRLAAPLPKLARVQGVILEKLVEPARAKVSADEAHGFVRGRSTVSNAAPHAKKGVVVNVDLENFFPSITFPRVRGLFESLGHSPCAATLLALLCTECPRVVVEHKGKKLWVAAGERALPQGACTSPALSNLACRKLDVRLRGIAWSSSLGLAYTRYADDLTFSAPTLSEQKLGHLLVTVEQICREEGFRVNAKKTRVMRKSARQEVTGIVVNAGARVPREEMRRLRAILHDAKKFGLDEANREKREGFPSWLRGKLSYVAMVDPLRGQAMLEQLDEIEAR